MCPKVSSLGFCWLARGQGKHQGRSPGCAAVNAVLFFRILVLEGGGQPGPQAKLGDATALPILRQSKLSSDSIFPLGFYTRI